MALDRTLFDDELLALLACPSDHGPLTLVDDRWLYNPRLRRKYAIDDEGIPNLLIGDSIEVDEAEHQDLMARAGGAK